MHMSGAAPAAFLILAACGGNAELSIARTYHSLDGDWNEIHPSVRVERDGMMAAAYRNSEGRATVSAGLVFRRDAMFCEAGLATGYSGAAVIPMGRCGIEAGRTRAFVFPEYVIGQGASVGVGVEFILTRF